MMGVTRGTSTPWADADDDVLREFYPTHGVTWDGWELLLPDRTPAAINRRAWMLGIRYEGPTKAHPFDMAVSHDRAQAAVDALDDWHRERLRILVGGA